MPWGLTCFHCSGQSHFVTFCCYHRRQSFTTGASRRVFESALERVRCSYRLYVYGYVVMPEHVHLLLSEPQPGSGPLKPDFGLSGNPRWLSQRQPRTLADALKSLKQEYRGACRVTLSISGKSGTTISTFGTTISSWRSCATFTAIRGPQRARFWLAGVEAGESRIVQTARGLGVEQFSPLRDRS